MIEQGAGPDDLQGSLPISTILWFCEVLKTTTCQLIWSHIRKATGSRKLDRTPLASAQEQNHIKCYYTEVGTELCLLCIGKGTRKLLSPWFWPLQRIQKPSEWPHSSSLHASTPEVWLHVWLCSIKTQVLITVTLLCIQPWLRSHFSTPFFTACELLEDSDLQRFPSHAYPYSTRYLKQPWLSPVMFTSHLSPSLSAKAGWIILLHMELSQQKKKNHLVVCSFTNLNKAPPRLK